MRTSLHYKGTDQEILFGAPVTLTNGEARWVHDIDTDLVLVLLRTTPTYTNPETVETYWRPRQDFTPTKQEETTTINPDPNTANPEVGTIVCADCFRRVPVESVDEDQVCPRCKGRH